MRLRDRFDRSKRKPSTRNQRIGFAFWWLVVLSYAYFISSTPNFNTESHLYTAFAIVDHHTVAIDAYQNMLGDKSYWHGHYYSDKAPGLAFLAVPAYAAFELAFPGRKGESYSRTGKWQYSIGRTTAYIRYALTYFLLIVPSAIFAVLLWIFLMQFLSAGWALLVAGSYALGTIAVPYSAWYFSHQICAMLLFGAFLILFSRARGQPADRRVLALTAVAGLMAGYSVICEYPTIVIAAMLFVYAVAVARSRVRSAAAFILGAVPPALLGVGYNLAAFGKPFATGYMHVSSYLYKNQVHGNGLGLANPLSFGVQAPTPYSLFQITFSSYRGLFFYCPVLLLFFVGAYYMWRRRELRAEWLLCLGVALVYILMVASRGEDQNGWSGGWSVASRHLVPIVPFMTVPIAFALQRASLRTVFVLLAAVSVGVMFAVMASGFGGGLPFGDHNPLVNAVWPHLRTGDIDVNWGWMLGLRGYPSLIPYLLVAGLLAARLAWLFRHREALPQPVRSTEHVGLELEATS